MRWLSLLLLGPLALAGSVRAADTSGGEIVYPRKTGDGYRLHVMKADGTGDHELPGQTAVLNIFPSISPDGKRIVYMTAASLNPQQHQVALINVDGSGATTVNAPSQRAGLGAWSPDGKQLAFAAGEQRPDLYVSDAQGNGVRKLNQEGSGGIGAFWMADGKRLGYTKFDEKDHSGQLVIVNADGSGEEVICKDTMPIAGANALSPDGKKLLYVVLDMQGKKGGLRCWNFEAKSESFLLDLELATGNEFENIPVPAWSPDGKSFLLPMRTDKGIGLFRVSEDGQTRIRLTPEGVDCLSGTCRRAQ